jgi:hypothetical protein
VSINTVLNKIRLNLVWVILPLSVIALSAELLPEVKAKVIVVPTLILMIALSILELRERRSTKGNWFRLNLDAYVLY